MITSKKDLINYIESDNSWYNPSGLKNILIAKFTNCPYLKIKKYLYLLRYQEYYINTANGNKIKGLLGLYYERKKNKLGSLLGIEIGPNCFGKGLQIFHAGSIIVNSSVQAGENCKLHGANCIGNNGKDDKTPILGNGVDIGYGAVLIGDIFIADDVVIGANALVNHSFDTASSIIAGVPAKIIK